MISEEHISLSKNLIMLIITIYIIHIYCNGPKTKESKNMKGKIAIVTGCSAGIGKETAKDLLKKGAIVIFACRDKTKTLKVINKITNESNKENAIYIHLNLTSFKSVNLFVQEFSNKFDKLDLLINNAGIINEKLVFTEDNLENTIQTNHISHFALTGLLMKYLKKSNDPRIINLSSMAHNWVNNHHDYFAFTEKTYRMFPVYSLSKAANVLFTESIKELAGTKKELKKIKSVCVHPGPCFTEFTRIDGKPLWFKIFMVFVAHAFMCIFIKSESMGAQTTLHCCYISRDKLINGGYYKDCCLSAKGHKLRKYDIEKKINKLTYNAVIDSVVYEDNKTRNKEFVYFMEFFKKKIES